MDSCIIYSVSVTGTADILKAFAEFWSCSLFQYNVNPHRKGMPEPTAHPSPCSSSPTIMTSSVVLACVNFVLRHHNNVSPNGISTYGSAR